MTILKEQKEQDLTWLMHHKKAEIIEIMDRRMETEKQTSIRLFKQLQEAQDEAREAKCDALRTSEAAAHVYIENKKLKAQVAALQKTLADSQAHIKTAAEPTENKELKTQLKAQASQVADLQNALADAKAQLAAIQGKARVKAGPGRPGISQDTATQVKEARADGMSIRAIARELHLSTTTVQVILRGKHF